MSQNSGRFPHDYAPADPGPGFGRFLAAARQLQDLAVSANPDDDGWEAAADATEAAVALLAGHVAAEGEGPANRVAELPGGGSLLMPPFAIRRYDADAVELAVTYRRFHVGGNNYVHGGVLPLLFDVSFGMLLLAGAVPFCRTAFLHVDYRAVTPIDTELTLRAWPEGVDGRKRRVRADLRDADDRVLVESHALMVQLRPGQP